MDNQKRFILVEPSFPDPDLLPDATTQWWWDTARPLKVTPEEPLPYIAVQMYKDRDPNQFVKIDEFHIVYTDQAEYYFVCDVCYEYNYQKQWSGSTRGAYNWREKSESEMLIHQHTKGWCEFCDPIFGNGGWL